MLQDEIQVQCHRFAEPLTGWPMLGVRIEVSPETSTRVARWGICYDGEVRYRVKWPQTATVNQAQIPWESGVQECSVWYEDVQGATHSLWTGPEPLPPQDTSPSAPVRRYPRWLSPVMTFARSAWQGEIWQAAWWTARQERYQKLSRRARGAARRRYQRVRDWVRPPFFSSPQRLTDRQKLQEQHRLVQLKIRPRFSIVCPVYNIAPKYLLALVDSVRQQIYPDWELILADDASTHGPTRRTLQQLPGLDPRIQVIFRRENGHICQATNTAINEAQGDWIVFTDHDDELDPRALLRFAEAIQANPGLDWCTTDEAKIDEAGQIFDRQVKPNWSPELLLSYNYVNHLVAVRRTLVVELGGLRVGFEGAQDYDFLLRLSERTTRVCHCPEVLYYWRALASSSAAVATVKPYIHDSACRALTEACQRRGWPHTVTQPQFARELGLPAYHLTWPTDVTRPKLFVLRLEHSGSGYQPLTPRENVTFYDWVNLTLPTAAQLRKVLADRSETWVMWLDAAVTPQNETSWDALFAYAILPGVAITTGLVMTREGAIQSAGLTWTDRLHGTFSGLTPRPVSYYFLAESVRNVIAPSPEVLLCRREWFLEQLDSLPEGDLAGWAYHLGQVARQRGERVVHVGPSVWVRQSERLPWAPSQQLRWKQRWQSDHTLTWDPYYRPQFEPERYPAAPAPATTDWPLPPQVKPPLVWLMAHNLSGFEGAPKVLYQLATGLVQRGYWRPEIYSPSAGPAEALYAQQGLTCFTPPWPHRECLLSGQWTRHQLDEFCATVVEQLRQTQPALIVVNTIGQFPLVLAAWRAGIPVVWLIHESYNPRTFESVFSWIAQVECTKALQTADCVVFVSQDCARAYRRLSPGDHHRVIYNGLDLAPWDQFLSQATRQAAREKFGWPADQLRFVAVGTLCERKAQHLLVYAAKELRRRRPGVSFAVDLVGLRPGPAYVSYLQEYVASAQLGDVVNFIPETFEVPWYLRAADVFVCMSYVEAFSLSVLEAMACHLPIISTPCGGLNEQVTWQRNALQVPFGAVNALVEQLGFFLDHPSARIEFGAESRAALELLPGPDEMLRQYARVISELLADPRP